MIRRLFALIVLGCLSKNIYCDNYYSIVGSKTIKPNSIYAVSVSLLDASRPTVFKLTLQNDKNFKLTNSVLVPPHSNKVVQFPIGKLDPGNYKLTAEGPNGQPFTNETTINLQAKFQSVFIQTDKAMYKPGDKVKFRVLVLDSNLNPATINKMNVFITDATGNRIKQWLNVKTNMGVYVQELQLSTNPPLGIWKINVDANDETHLKDFEIAEYVLPKFEVKVSAPNDLTYSDKVVRLTVTAKYTFGENVKGTVLVSVKSQAWSSTPTAALEKKVDINGNGFVELQMSDLKVTSQNWQDTFDVKASVTESLTGKVLEGTTTFTIRRTKFTVTNLNDDKTYTPGKPFTLILKFAYHDGSPYIITKSPIKVSYGPNSDKSNIIFLKSGFMDSTGIAKIDVALPDSTSGFYIFVQFLDFNENVGYYTKPSPLISSDKNSINARLITKNAKINDTVSVEITSSKPLSSVNYLISSRGKLVSSARKNVPNKNSFRVTFTATFDMVPSGKFLIYYLVSNGDIVSTNIEFPVTGLNNFVNLETSANERQPGEMVNISISSKPLSNVCLLGVDQSVVLLKSGNDIEQSDVFTELGAYNQVSFTQPIGGPIRPFIDFRRPGFFPPSRGGWADFDAANLYILTNANTPPIIFLIRRQPGIPMVDIAEENSLPQPSPPQSNQNVAPQILPRPFPWFRGPMPFGALAMAGSAPPPPLAPQPPPNAITPTILRVKRPVRMHKALERSEMQPAPSQSQNNAIAPTILMPIWFDAMMPMAMAMDGAAPPSASPELPPNAVAPTIRKYFPETWLWNCNCIGSNNTLTLPELVPDTITSWYITAFATNKKHGLAVTEKKTVFKVFKKFFLSLNLPYSIKRGETLALSIVVFNYMSQKVTAKVTLDNSRKEFEFVDPLTQAYRKKGCVLDIELSRTKTIDIPSNDGVQLTFLITPLITGPMVIKVTASSPIAADGMEVTLPVVPEGVTQYRNKAKFIDLRQSNTYTTDFTVDVPSNAVKDSTQVSFSVIGDLMGVTLKNIQTLIQLPSGCGEQTMLGLAPDVVILAYLTKTGRLTGDIKKQLINYLEIGYQGELCYLHPDGSFSAFGKSDGSGSTWLTAFVARIFIQASDYITIDSAVITKALEWLKSLQKSDGSFSEPGRVIHSDMQGQASKGVALTAYVIIAFAQNEANAKKYSDVISRALNYVKVTLDALDDVYSLAIACYAAHLANHPSKGDFLQKLDKLAKTQGDLKYWEKVQLTTPSDPWSRPPSVNVEITAYALLSYIKAGKIIEGVPVMRWLLSQQSSSGGFSSTQDTVMGTTALASFAAEMSGGNTMSCLITYVGGQSTLNVNKDNSLVLQTIELPKTTKSVKAKCTGSGFSLAQLTYQFNLNAAEISPSFKLDVSIDKKSNDYSLILNICTSFIASADGDTSNMAVIEAELPTGFIADLQTIKDSLGKTKDVKKIETRNGNTVVVIYLDNVGANQICLQITAYRNCEIADEKAAAVQVYDYYNNIRRKTKFYQRKPKELCGICVDDLCKAACKKPLSEVTCPKRTG